jgi:hypothetical protein
MKPKRATPKTPKNKPQRFSTKVQLLAHLIPACEKEYQATFGHAWSDHPLRLYKDDLQRSQVESDAWRVMSDLRKAAAAALDFFESRGLNAARPDNGIYYAHELHKLLRRHRRLLEALKEKVGEYPRPLDKRYWLVRLINVGGPNAFAGLPYGRKLNGRELALISFLMLGSKELAFTESGMTINDAIDQERRRMAIANRRVRLPRKR